MGEQVEQRKRRDREDHSSASRYAITFGEVAVLHVGGEEVGMQREHGYSVDELESLAAELAAGGACVELISLTAALPPALRKGNEAATLLIRNGASVLLQDKQAATALLCEQQGLTYDSKYWDGRRSRTLNKRARHNLVFADKGVDASSDYKQFTIKAFAELPRLAAFRAALQERLGEKAHNLLAEGNHYFETSSGIGFHGDSERKIVICLSLGATSTLRYCWRLPGSSENTGQVDIEVHHGDVYVMSEKATGFDWRCRSKTRLVHAAGSAKYIGT